MYIYNKLRSHSQISFVLLTIDICLNKFYEHLTKITFVKTTCLSMLSILTTYHDYYAYIHLLHQYRTTYYHNSTITSAT